MFIEIKLKEDRPTKMPFWSAMVKHEGNVVMEVVSQTFNPKNEKAFELMYENMTVRLLKELQKTKDQTMLKHMLINNTD